MKQLALLVIVVTLFATCQKDSDSEAVRELDITYKSVSDVSPGNTIYEHTFYPNPFKDIVMCWLSTEGAEIVITNGSGGMKKIAVDGNRFSFDFSNEPAGSYYFEVKMGAYVYRDHLIKID